MRVMKNILLALMASPLTLVPAAYGQQTPSASSRTALPITITKGISANSAHIGDPIYARTMQPSQLPNGMAVPAGTRVLGHVVSTSGPVKPMKLVNDVAPVSTLTVRFDSIELAKDKFPIDAYVRAMADPYESSAASMAEASDIDSQSTTTQVGGDLLTPSQKDVIDQEGRVVGHNLYHGVYARLRNSGNCLGTNTEVSVGIFSGAACGLYGFTGIDATGMGTPQTHDLTLTSKDGTSRVWRDSTALLVVLAGS